MLIMFANALALMRLGVHRILHGNQRDEGFVWLLTGLAFFGVLVWTVPRIPRKTA
ncbi:MAG: hypothetical protein WAM85_20345 [Terracidiphilus sp.]